MPIQVTIILDSGVFLPIEGDNSNHTEIGYFQSHQSVPDIQVRADGNLLTTGSPMNLGKKCQIEIRHVKANGSIKKDGVKSANGFHGGLLHMKHLYGKHISVDRKKFDCVLRFDSGLFCGAKFKPRTFKEYVPAANGQKGFTPSGKTKTTREPIPHDIHVLFKLGKGEAIELARDGEVFWSSQTSGAKERLEIEIVADNSTAEKFYRHALKDKHDSYWLPNQGNPPPVCSEPPCRPPLAQ
jgi:hypothetical protein